MTKEEKAAYWKAYRAKHLPYKSKSCKECSQVFNPVGSQLRCANCRSVVCETCSTVFTPEYRTKRKRFCSRRCMGRSQAGEEPQQLKKNRGRKPRTYHLRTDIRSQHAGAEYADWRKKVFERDDYTCQICKVRGGRLNADHIKDWAAFPLLRFDITNGRTLCVPCHKTTETYGWAKYHARKRLAQESLFASDTKTQESLQTQSLAI